MKIEIILSVLRPFQYRLHLPDNEVLRKKLQELANMSTKCRLKGVLAYDILRIAKKASDMVLL